MNKWGLVKSGQEVCVNIEPIPGESQNVRKAFQSYSPLSKISCSLSTAGSEMKCSRSEWLVSLSWTWRKCLNSPDFSQGVGNGVNAKHYVAVSPTKKKTKNGWMYLNINGKEKNRFIKHFPWESKKLTLGWQWSIHGPRVPGFLYPLSNSFPYILYWLLI